MALQADVDATAIAVWFGHAGVRSTDDYVHADLCGGFKHRSPITGTITPPSSA